MEKIETTLRDAAEHIEWTLEQLDLSETTCRECGLKHFSNWEHARLYKQLITVPERLRELARVLDADARRTTTPAPERAKEKE